MQSLTECAPSPMRTHNPHLYTTIHPSIHPSHLGALPPPVVERHAACSSPAAPIFVYDCDWHDWLLARMQPLSSSSGRRLNRHVHMMSTKISDSPPPPLSALSPLICSIPLVQMLSIFWGNLCAPGQPIGVWTEPRGPVLSILGQQIGDIYILSLSYELSADRVSNQNLLTECRGQAPLDLSECKIASCSSIGSKSSKTKLGL